MRNPKLPPPDPVTPGHSPHATPRPRQCCIRSTREDRSHEAGSPMQATDEASADPTSPQTIRDDLNDAAEGKIAKPEDTLPLRGTSARKPAHAGLSQAATAIRVATETQDQQRPIWGEGDLGE